MKKLLISIGIVCLCFAALILSSMQIGKAGEVNVEQRPGLSLPALNAPTAAPALPAMPTPSIEDVPIGCALQPSPIKIPARSAAYPIHLPLSRFRQSAAVFTSQRSARTPNYTPIEEIQLADLTNFGDRYLRDVRGQSAVHDPIVVLHETVGSAQSAVNFFQTPHPIDDDQASYHTLIAADGRVIYLVPPDKRAYGAGDSVFEGANGIEAVQTNPEFPPSVNNFAYHISLETPADGDNNNTAHSGYTNAQYQSLAWLVSKTGVLDSRITMHKLVDRSGQRMDPRSFDMRLFSNLLGTYPRTREISIGCLAPKASAEKTTSPS